ncbi:MAG: AAA family ATPase [Mycobacteriales bacterium]
MTAYTSTYTSPDSTQPPRPSARIGAATRGMAGGDVATVQEVAALITHCVERAIEGKHHVIRLALAVMLSGGHLLIEDVPGVGKTTLAKALARSIDGTIRRIQFTPDLLPSDIVGVSIYNQNTRGFEFQPGAVFSHLLVADEINRASPKTQSALLECMEEQQVTTDSETYPLENPFMVIATQNPIEMEGTYPLPEAQRDRFTARVAMGYPDARAEVAMLDEHGSADPIAVMSPVSSTSEIAALISTVAGVYVSPAVKQYVVSLVRATRNTPQLRLGASPRAALQLLRTARAVAALEGRDFVLPDDVAALAAPVLAHRLLLDPEVRAAGGSATDVIEKLVAHTPVVS